ncbi:D-Ala-D-Ala carboxypeptidase family metallohydrolase [Sphingomonas sp. AAP5]|uniref:D-Ala-D-Ala carboxypeptidase family metallohydrolase n=1 Tax=Sphingomonas sp. AAP5 TaxID=1523415 RepID=UPI0019D06F5C|nr:D-Ala-D-Ala carboxypeptidase family metallohydrolase [Sphingomonas sp. AAP5]
MATDPTQLMNMLASNSGLAGQFFQQGQNDARKQQVDDQNIALNAAKLNQMKQQAVADASFQNDWGTYLKNPTTDGLAQIAVKYPSHTDAVKEFWAIKDPEVRQSHIAAVAPIVSALHNNRPDLAIISLQGLRDASAKAGQPTDDYDQEIAALKSGDKDAINAVKGTMMMHLAAVDTDGKFAESLAKAQKAMAGPDGYTLGAGDTRFDGNNAVVARGIEKPTYEKVANGDGSESIVQVGGGGGSSAVSQGTGPGTPANPSPRWSSAQLAQTVPFGGTVTSGVRSAQHNAAVGGVPNSQHVAGTAIDVVFPKGVTTQQVKDYYAKQGASVQVIHENAGDPHSTGDHFHIQGASPNAAPVTSQAHFNDSGTKVLYTSKGRPGGASGPAPSGYRYKGDGTLEPIPGGPSDATQLTPESANMMAQQYLAGDKTVLQGLGRGKQGGAAIAQVRAAITKQALAQGMTGRDIAAQMADFSGVVASERATGTRTAQVELAATEAQRLAPLALAASDALPRAGWTPVAGAVQSVQSGTNDVRLRRFVTANNALVNTYARAVSPTGVPTVDAQNHAREILNTAQDQASYHVVVQQMMKEIAAARAAPRDVRNDLRNNVGGNYKPGGGAPFQIKILGVRPK